MLPVYPVMDAVEWLPWQPDTGLLLPNLSQKVPKAGEQQTAAGVKEEARKNNFSSGFAGAGPGRHQGWAQLGAASKADVRMCQP